MTTMTQKILDFIPDMAQELPSLITGEPTSIDRLMLAAGICGWITDYQPADTTLWGRTLGDRDTHALVLETGTEDNHGFVLALKWENGELVKTIDYTGCTAEELADLGRAFLNAALAKHQQERRK